MDPGGEGEGVGTLPYLLTINAFELGHTVGTPLFKTAGSAPAYQSNSENPMAMYQGYINALLLDTNFYVPFMGIMFSGLCVHLSQFFSPLNIENDSADGGIHVLWTHSCWTCSHTVWQCFHHTLLCFVMLNKLGPVTTFPLYEVF